MTIVTARETTHMDPLKQAERWHGQSWQQRYIALEQTLKDEREQAYTLVLAILARQAERDSMACMTDFKDSIDPDLGAACDRLAAFRARYPDDDDATIIDASSMLTVGDIDAVLVKLYHTRKASPVPVLSMEEAGKRYGARPE